MLGRSSSSDYSCWPPKALSIGVLFVLLLSSILIIKMRKSIKKAASFHVSWSSYARTYCFHHRCHCPQTHKFQVNLHHEAERSVCSFAMHAIEGFRSLSSNACIELCHLDLETLQPPIRNHIWSSSQEVRSSILVLFQQVNRCMHHQDLKPLHHILLWLYVSAPKASPSRNTKNYSSEATPRITVVAHTHTPTHPLPHTHTTLKYVALLITMFWQKYI